LRRAHHLSKRFWVVGTLRSAHPVPFLAFGAGLTV
jgi:hypothetical protein